METEKLLPGIVINEPVAPNIKITIDKTKLKYPKLFDSLALAEENYSKYMVFVYTEQSNSPAPIFNEIGVLGRIISRTTIKNNLAFKIECLSRVNVVLEMFGETTSFFKVADIDEKHSNISEEEILIKKVYNEYLGSDTHENYSQSFIPKDKVYFNDKISYIEFPQLLPNLPASIFSNVASMMLRKEHTEKMKYVFETDITKRLFEILKDIETIKYFQNLDKKIQDEVNNSVAENQKEYYLREKMKAIQNELGQKAKKETEIEEYRNKINNSGMPDNIREKALDILNKFEMTNNFMAESNVLSNYLDFIISLPWNVSSHDVDDINQVKETLDKNHFGLDKVKDRILEYLSVKILTNKNPQTILCLVGPPGVGKTTLAISIAEALGRKFIKQSLGGLTDEAEIRGHRRTYVGALPGRILKSMVDAKTINPVFLLDEIDKLSKNWKGDPASAMLEVLDPEQNAKFSDNYLEETYDLSQVLFITTANYLDNIPPALIDRMEIVQLSSYTEHEKFQIAQTHVIPKQLSLHGIDSNKFEITNDAIYYIIRHYTREAGVREVQRLIGTLVRKSIREILADKVEKVVIDIPKLKLLLGNEYFEFTQQQKLDRIGVVTGLAYTQFGGDTLSVEATYYRGRGALLLTGKLGDVMKESATAAMSYIKANKEKYNIKDDFFDVNDLHVHCPEGAVPKDGPSAGITIATAILSAITSRAVSKDLGMTGEITLRGDVLPIGGLKEKSIAALRSGLKKILIPKENLRDLDEIPSEVKDNLEIVPVEFVSEVFDIVFL
jgi:ATP-dependent Lon protease